MSEEREFDCLVTFVADIVIRWSCRSGGVRVDTLQQALCDRYGPEHFRRKRNANMLADAVEYLLYTNRVNLCCCEGGDPRPRWDV